MKWPSACADIRLGWAFLGLAIGCSGGKPHAPASVDVDGAAAAARALELYDANSDGAIDSAEAAKCPPLVSDLANIDKDSDKKISLQELSDRIAAIATGPLTGPECSVALGGQPLVGATVKLQPADFYDGELPPAEGKSDESGVVRPTISAERLPERLANAALAYPGFYIVQVTHEQSTIPERYGAASELGWVIDSTARSGASTRFDLKTN
jgi:hypothetical protein